MKSNQIEINTSPQRAVLTVDGKKIHHNLLQIASHIAKQKNLLLKNNKDLVLTKQTVIEKNIMAVVKANAYGFCTNNVVPLLLSAGIKNWGIATAIEAVEIKKLLTLKREKMEEHSIYLLGNSLPEELPLLIKQGIIIGFSSLTQLHQALAIAKIIKKPVKLQWLINTGMGRLGTPLQEVEETLKTLCKLAKRKNNYFQLVAAFSHFASAEIPNDKFTIKQTEIFQKLEKKIEKCFPSSFFHLAASFGITYSAAIKQMFCRIGIAMYGVGQYVNHKSPSLAGNTQWAPAGIKLQPTIKLEAAVVSVRWLLRGSCVGYNSLFHMPQNGYLATLAIGYADGVIAALKNGGKVIIGGSLYPVVGKISMDYTTIYLGAGVAAKKIASSCNRVNKKPYFATLLGKNGKAEILAEEWASLANQSHHNILTSLGSAMRVNKKFIPLASSFNKLV